MNPQVFKIFDWLRFPLILGVVFIHSFGDSFDYEALDLSNFSGIDFYNLFRVSISKVLTHVCVPTFYFISGYLFFVGLEKWDTNKFWQKLKRRSRSLLVPFLIWNTICILLKLKGYVLHGSWDGINSFLSTNGYLHLYWDCQQWNLDRTNWIGWLMPSSSPYLIPLWFLRDLMVVVLCSPIVYLIIKRMRKWGIILFLLLYFSNIFIRIPGFSSVAFCFFGIGGYMSINNINPIDWTLKYKTPAFIVAFVTWVACTLFNGHETKIGDIIYPFYVTSGCLSLMNIARYMVQKRRLFFLSQPLFTKGSFFVYLSHTIMVLELCTKACKYVFGETNPFLLTISYLVVPIMTTSTCLLFYYIIKRIVPNLCGVLTGER